MSNPELSKFEKIVIILALIIGFIGGTILVFVDKTPAIIISILLATGIATLVYHFLGGIENAQFNTGAIKLGGSMAALLASAWLINPQLEKQLNSISNESKYHINANYEIVNSNHKILGKIRLDNYNLKLDKDLNVIAGDSIKLGTLTLKDLILSEDFEIIANDTIILGNINKQSLFDLGGFSQPEVINYTEIKFNTRLNNPFDYKIDESPWDDVNGYRGIYYALPFEIKPYGKDRSFKTKILFNDGTEKSAPIKRNESIFITDFNKNDIHIFIVRVRQISESQPWDTYSNFVQYQIIEFAGSLEFK
ncbi:MAG: hypothetical protein ACLFVR_06565 [Thiohalospira sp.]